MKIWAISDTHGFHDQLEIPEVDTVIFAGDSTNFYGLPQNLVEYYSFITWFKKLDIKNKILIAGNHDAWATQKYNISDIKSARIHYLEHEYLDLEGLKIFGSPYTPTFGMWYFMKSRDTINRQWEYLDNDIDILITHGPPYGILDQTEGKVHQLQNVGDSSLFKKILKIQPREHIFGHVHDAKSIRNSGTKTINRVKTVFRNVSCVQDGRFDLGLTSNGQTFTI